MPSAALLDRLASNITFICQIWKITSADGLVAAFAAHTRDLVFESVTYKAAPVEPTRFSETLGLDQANHVELFGVLDDVITETDIQGGRWKNAKIVSQYVDYLSLADGSVKKIKGQAGKFTIQNGTFRVEQRSLTDLLQQEIGDLTSPVDRNRKLADLVGAGNLGPYTFNRTITAAADRCNFTVDGSAQIDDYFRYGLATFVTRGFTWTDLVQVTVIANNGLQKNAGGTAYNAGAASVEYISAGQYAQCSAESSTNTTRTFGLSSVNGGATQATIQFGVEMANSAGTRTGQVYELGVAKGSSFSFVDTDFVRIRYGLDNVIRYYLVTAGVESLKYTSLATPASRLLVDVSIHTQPATLLKPKIGMDSGIQSMEIKGNVGNAIQLQIPTMWAVSVDDSVTLLAGYDGTRTQARDKFGAAANLRSEPDLPGIRGIIEYPE